MGVVHARVRSRSRAARRAQGAAQADAATRRGRGCCARHARWRGWPIPTSSRVHEVGIGRRPRLRRDGADRRRHPRRLAARGARAPRDDRRRVHRRRARARRGARRGLVHRDFKPHNVLRSRGGRIVVTDFGLARGVGTRPSVATGRSRRCGRSRSEITVTGSLLGTPAYMAPEQWRGGRGRSGGRSVRVLRRAVGGAGRRAAVSRATTSRACASRSGAVPRRSTRRSCRAGCARCCGAGSIPIRRSAGRAWTRCSRR